MREPPKLAADVIQAAVREHYGIATRSLSFLPLGADSGTSVYRLEAADGATWFVKLRTRGGFGLPSLVVPRCLCDQGLPHIIAPLPTRSHAVWVDLGDFALTLYPYIDGRSGADAGLTADHWRAFGALMRRVHDTALPAAVAEIVPRESFIPSRRELMPAIEAAAGRASSAVEREFAAIWRANEDLIHTLVERADALAERLRRHPGPPALCHADMHLWNTLVDSRGDFWLIDWDETVMAPRERDLMFVVGGIGGGGVGPEQTDWFLAGYGETAIDPVALAYYRYAWAVQDMAAYGEQVFFLPGLSEASRRDGVRGFASVLGPGGIATIALASEIDWR